MDNFDLKKYLTENKLGEIKVNTPNKNFTFTDKFRQDLEEFGTCIKLLDKFFESIDVWDDTSDDDLGMIISNIEMYEGEGIINFNSTNNIDKVFEGLVNVGFYDENDKDLYKELLEEWMGLGWITKIIL